MVAGERAAEGPADDREVGGGEAGEVLAGGGGSMEVGSSLRGMGCVEEALEVGVSAVGAGLLDGVGGVVRVAILML